MARELRHSVILQEVFAYLIVPNVIVMNVWNGQNFWKLRVHFQKLALSEQIRLRQVTTFLSLDG